MTVTADRDERLTLASDFLRTPRQHFIDGAFSPAADGGRLDVVDPATDQVVGQIAAGTAADVDLAVAAAGRALHEPTWRGMDPHERGRLLYAVADAIEANAEELAQLDCLDTGMPLAFARAFTADAVRTFRYFAGWPTKIFGETNPSSGGMFSYTRREPVGVCALVIAWNGPIGSSAWKLAPALACGNTAVLKPAEQASLSPLRLAEIMTGAGIPAGVVNVVTGLGAVAGQALVQHPDVSKVSFTGSTETGHNFAKLVLETGGKSPNIVFADADLDAAAAAAVSAFCLLSGQICNAGSRLLVQRSVYADFVERLVAIAKGMSVGDPVEGTTMMGPLVSRQQLDKVTGFIEQGRASGARIALDGVRDYGPGYYVGPTIFVDADNSMDFVRQEIFGPVVAVIPFDDEDDAAAIANDTDFGLAAAVWTKDIGRAHRFTTELQAGTVWVNTYLHIDPIAPWGGYKRSGISRELGREAIETFTETKVVYVKL